MFKKREGYTPGMLCSDCYLIKILKDGRNFLRWRNARDTSDKGDMSKDSQQEKELDVVWGTKQR